MSVLRRTAQFEIDFLFFGTIEDYAKTVYIDFRESIKKAPGSPFIRSSRGEELTLAGHPLYHENVTIEFEYNLDESLQLPRIIETIREYAMWHLNSEKCAVLENIYSMGYFSR